MWRLWGRSSTARSAPRTPAAEPAIPPNLHNPALAKWYCPLQRATSLITDSLLRVLFHRAPVRAWRGSRWKPPTTRDLRPSLDRLLNLEPERPWRRQSPARSNWRGRCCRAWCSCTIGLQAPNQQPQLQVCLLRRFPAPRLCRSASSRDRGVQGKWPRWGSPYPLRDLCPWSPNGLPSSTWSPIKDSSEDLLIPLQERTMVSLSGLLAHRFVIMHSIHSETSLVSPAGWMLISFPHFRT